MDPLRSDLLERLAARYVWWKTPEETMAMPDRIIAQVMDIGDYEDVQAMVEQVGDDCLRNVLRNAEISLHCRLEQKRASPGQSPPSGICPK